MSSESSRLPVSVVRRLTKYISSLQRLHLAGQEWVSSQELAQQLDLTSSTVRQDLTHVDYSGVSKRGYKTAELLEVLTRVVGGDTEWNVVVVGAGNLGRALVLHEEFGRRRFNIRGVFDNDPARIGQRIGPLVVQDARKLPAFVGMNRIEMGMIAVPPSAAQPVADLLVAAGIRGIVNFSLAHVVVPARVPVVDSRIAASLMELAHAIKFGPRPAIR